MKQSLLKTIEDATRLALQEVIEEAAAAVMREVARDKRWQMKIRAAICEVLGALNTEAADLTRETIKRSMLERVERKYR